MRGLGWACGACLAALLAVGANAQAQDHPRAGRMLDRLAAADTNGDGAITRDEARAARAAMFDRLDADGDGFLTDADRQARMQAMMDRRGRRAMAAAGMDADNDGRISRAEFSSGPMPGFDRLDADRNGVLEQSEVAAARAARASRGQAQ